MKLTVNVTKVTKRLINVKLDIIRFAEHIPYWAATGPCVVCQHSILDKDCWHYTAEAVVLELEEYGVRWAHQQCFDNNCGKKK